VVGAGEGQQPVGLDDPAHVIDNAIELGPVETRFDASGSRIAATSMDGSLKIYEIDQTPSGSISSSLALDSNQLDAANLGDMAVEEPNGGNLPAVDPWRVSFNPKNSG